MLVVPICFADNIGYYGVNGRNQDGAASADDSKDGRNQNDVDGDALSQG